MSCSSLWDLWQDMKTLLWKHIFKTGRTVVTTWERGQHIQGPYSIHFCCEDNVQNIPRSREGRLKHPLGKPRAKNVSKNILSRAQQPTVWSTWVQPIDERLKSKTITTSLSEQKLTKKPTRHSLSIGALEGGGGDIQQGWSLNRRIFGKISYLLHVCKNVISRLHFAAFLLLSISLKMSLIAGLPWFLFMWSNSVSFFGLNSSTYKTNQKTA